MYLKGGSVTVLHVAPTYYNVSSQAYSAKVQFENQALGFSDM
jgi:hypothetical protein